MDVIDTVVKDGLNASDGGSEIAEKSTTIVAAVMMRSSVEVGVGVGVGDDDIGDGTNTKKREVPRDTTFTRSRHFAPACTQNLVTTHA